MQLVCGSEIWLEKVPVTLFFSSWFDPGRLQIESIGPGRAPGAEARCAEDSPLTNKLDPSKDLVLGVFLAITPPFSDMFLVPVLIDKEQGTPAAKC